MSQTQQAGQFWECATCRVKPGSPTLCDSCLHNRLVVSKLNARSKTAWKFWDKITTRTPIKHSCAGVETGDVASGWNTEHCDGCKCEAR